MFDTRCVHAADNEMTDDRRSLFFSRRHLAFYERVFPFVFHRQKRPNDN